MKVIWANRAVSDLNRIGTYIERDNPAAANRVVARIIDEASSLVSMPHRGRVGLAVDTRELVFYPCPYIAVYRIMDTQIRILRIRHASQNWP